MDVWDVMAATLMQTKRAVLLFLLGSAALFFGTLVTATGHALGMVIVFAGLLHQVLVRVQVVGG